MNKMDGGSLNIEQMEMEKLKSVFPQCFADGKLDIDKLLSLCGEYIDNDFEKYKFEWKGKSESLRLAQQRSMATLRPAVEDSVNWDSTENLYIEGDNLEVLKLLQTAYYRKVKMIYIDPPYNTGNDFVYEDDFKDPLSKYKEITGQTTKSNPESMGRFHTNWLNMIYPRLRLASNLLSDDGVIFISIDDNEVHNLRKVCDEVFGEENFVAQFLWKKRTGSNDAINNVSTDHEYILCYGKSTEIKFSGIKKQFEKYSNPDNDPRGDWARDNLTCNKTVSERPNLAYSITDPVTGIIYQCNPNRAWAYEKCRMEQMIKEGKVLFPKDEKGTPMYKRHKAEVKSDTKPYSSLIETQINAMATKEVQELLECQVFSYPKTVNLVKQLINQATDNDSIILDFFSGSGTTAHAVMQLNAEDGGNRKFICVQLPEVTDEKSEAYKAGYKNICEIGKERIRRAGVKIQSKQSVKSEGLFSEEQKPLDIGFKVFKLDTSNLKTWDATPTDNPDLFMERMNDMIDTIKQDRSDMDLVYEIMLKMGVPLTYSVTAVEIGGKQVYSIGEESLLLICLQEGLTSEIIEEMANDYIPSKIILSEKCFADDTAMANAHYILKEREIELKLV